MKIYLDNCCYNRPFDDQTQDRIHIESEAVLAILRMCENGIITILSSPILRLEIEKSINEDKREKVIALYSLAHPDIPFTEAIRNRAEELRSKSSIRLMDSLHIAAAETGGAEYMLTTDDKLRKSCEKLYLNTKVINPVTFMIEVVIGDEK